MENETFLSDLSSKIKQKYQFPKTEELEDVRMKWYKTKLVYDAVHEACDEDAMHQLSGSHEGGEIISELRERLSLAESEQVVRRGTSASNDGHSNVLAINSARRLPPPKQAMMAEFRRIVNERISKKLLAVSQFYQPSSVTAGSNLLYAKSSQLHAVILKDVDTVNMKKKEIESLKQQRTLQVQKLHQEYSGILQLLETLLFKLKLSGVRKYEMQNVHYFTAKTEALIAKIGFIEKEMLADTYSPEIVHELAIVRKQLDDKLAKTSESLQKVTIEYQSCLAAGTEFQRIANEYSQLKKDIEARTWALQELDTAKQHRNLL